MRILLPFVALLIGAAPLPAPQPAPVPDAVPIGTFRTWLPSRQAAIDMRSGGVDVHVEALPCPAQPVGDTACRWDGYNNQGLVTVRAPGVPPLSVKTDPQSSYARIAVVRFARGDARPGVIVESQSGGSSGNLTVQLLVPAGTGYRVLPVAPGNGGPLQGELADTPRDVSGDGAIDLIWQDGAFAHVFGCNACTPRPPRVFAVQGGRVVDESRDPALRPVFAADMARLAPRCLSKVQYRNGACAAYVADAARAGRLRSAWAKMLAHYERDGDFWRPCDGPASARCSDHAQTFPASLRVFLTRAGYLPA